MKTTITLNGITQEIELTPEQERLFKVGKTGWERVEEECQYYYTQNDLEAVNEQEYYTAYDNNLYNLGFYHSTEEHAIKQAKIDSLRRRIQRFADENYPDVKWDGENEHWDVVRNDGCFYIRTHTIMRTPFQIHFGSKEGAEKAIELFGDEIKEMMGV
jgi:hypothetical protein